MPFRSRAQARFLFSQKPQLAKEFAAKTTKRIKDLPARIGPKKKATKPYPGKTKEQSRAIRNAIKHRTK